MLCTRATVEARLRLPWVQEAGEARGGRGGLLLIANYLSRQLRTIIRHAVRGACAAFRDIARVRSELSLSLSRRCVRACVRACVSAAPVESAARGGGERETGVPDSVTPTVDALSPFFSPLPLPSPFVRLPRAFPLPFLSILLAKRASPSLSLTLHLPFSLSLSRDRALASRDHSLRGCAAAAITARSARGLYLERDERLAPTW